MKQQQSKERVPIFNWHAFFVLRVKYTWQQDVSCRTLREMKIGANYACIHLRNLGYYNKKKGINPAETLIFSSFCPISYK